MDEFPQELNALVGKTLLFKLTARLDSITKFQSCVIMVSRICSDPEIITAFASQNCVNLPGSQKLAATLAASVRVSDDLDEIGGVVVSTTPLNSRDATPCAVEDASMVTHTPMKWICVKSIDGGSSHVPSTASRNLLPTFDKNITKEHTDPSGMDI
ncbi:hypothetical protein S83_035980 [Arachis hypogaea]